MASSHDLTTEQGLSAYLTSKNIEHSSVKLLTGGTANYVYRVTLPSGETTIYKHAAPYLHSNTAFPFDPSRMDYEDRVLELLPPLLTQQLPRSSVNAVQVHSYDRENKLLRIQDGGERHLKDAYTDPALDIPQLGAELGTWLAALHSSTRSTSLSATPSTDTCLEANNAVGVAIYRHAYRNLGSAFAEYRSSDDETHNQASASAARDVDFAAEINDSYGSRLASENECVCHGDFWPGNVLLQAQGTSLTIVDWEMARRGTSATDVAQFCAEAFLLDRFRGRRGLLPPFLNAYLAARWDADGEGVGREWFRRMAVHWGVHVAYWPTRVAWTDREGTRELVDMGMELLKAATEGRWGVLFSKEPLKGVEVRYKDVF